MLLFFDTETTGLVKFKDGPDHVDQPRVVQYAALLYSDEGKEVGSISTLVRTDVPIHHRAEAVHGISQMQSTLFGISPKTLVDLHTYWVNMAHTIVCHNVQFDKLVMATMDYSIYGFRKSLLGPGERTYFCTMEKSTDVLRLSGKFGKYKWPKLTEACEYFFGKGEREDFELEAHDALADVRMTKRVYMELR